MCFFFFSSRRRHTRYWRNWSSDVCSSDLFEADGPYGPGDPIAHLLARNAEVLQAESDVVLDERGDEAVLGVLEKEAQVLTDLEGFRGRVVVGDPHAARVGPQEAVQEADQGGLATAVRAYHADVFSWAKVEAHL